MLGGLGMNPSQLPVVGNIGKSLGLWDDPNEQAYRQALQQAAQQVQQYRPMEAQARMNALGNQLSLMGPMNAALGQAYGPGFQFDTNRLLQNPMPQGMSQIGTPGYKPQNPVYSAPQAPSPMKMMGMG